MRKQRNRRSSGGREFAFCAHAVAGLGGAAERPASDAKDFLERDLERDLSFPIGSPRARIALTRNSNE